MAGENGAGVKGDAAIAEMRDSQHHYLTFISIVFGVFISVWIEPLVSYLTVGLSDSERDVVSFDLKHAQNSPLYVFFPSNYEEEIGRLIAQLNAMKVNQKQLDAMTEKKKQLGAKTEKERIHGITILELKGFGGIDGFKGYEFSRSQGNFFVANDKNRAEGISIRKEVFRGRNGIYIYAPEALEAQLRKTIFEKGINLSFDPALKDDSERITKFFAGKNKYAFTFMEENKYAAFQMKKQEYNFFSKIGLVLAIVDVWMLLQSLLMFLILISLWWWYGLFLGALWPADSLWSYGYDFISLGIFAIAFRFYDNEILYPSAVILASVLFLIRFGFLRYKMRDKKVYPRKRYGQTRRGLSIGMGFLIVCAFLLIFFGLGVASGSKALENLTAVNIAKGVVIFHITAVVMTMLVAAITQRELRVIWREAAQKRR